VTVLRTTSVAPIEEVTQREKLTTRKTRTGTTGTKSCRVFGALHTYLGIQFMGNLGDVWGRGLLPIKAPKKEKCLKVQTEESVQNL